MSPSYALTQETYALQSEVQADWYMACVNRLAAAEAWKDASGFAVGLDAADALVASERNARALAANADRLADALSALRGRAG